MDRISESRYKALLAKRTVVAEEYTRAVEQLEAARAEGDLSENAGYEAARINLTDVQLRLDKIDSILSSCVIVQTSVRPAIGIGDTLEIKQVGSDKPAKIVTLEDTGSVSLSDSLGVDSPLGKKVLGRESGEYDVKMPLGTYKYEVRKLDKIAKNKE